LLCSPKLLHWWSDQSIVEGIIKFIQNQKGGDGNSCFDLRMVMLGSIIQWALQNNEHYARMPDKYKDMDVYIDLFLTHIYEGDSTDATKVLVNFSVKFSKQWNEMTTQYPTVVLINRTMKWCLKDQKWFATVLQTLTNKNFEAVQLQLMTEYLNETLTDKTLRGIVQEYFSFQID